MLIEPPQSLQLLLLLLYLCCVLVPCINIQTSRKGFAFYLLQMSTKPSIGLSGLEDAVWQSTHRSSLPGRGVCIKQGGGIFVNKTIAKALLCDLLFAFSLARQRYLIQEEDLLHSDFHYGSSFAAVVRCQCAVEVVLNGVCQEHCPQPLYRRVSTSWPSELGGLNQPKRGGGSFDVQRTETKWCCSLRALIIEQQESIRVAAFFALQ